MAENNHTPPNMDVNQILQTLASLTQVPAFNGQDQGQQQSSQEYYQPHQHHPRHYHRPAPQKPPPQQQPHRAATPATDATRITTWKQGIRHINKISAQDPTFECSIQKLIKAQERNVRDWGNGRKRLIEELKAKRENEEVQRQLLPSMLNGVAPLRTAETDREELSQYDAKVYRASKQMSESHSRELQRLGVPFFGLRPELVRPDDAGTPDEDEQGNSRTLTKKELLELQRKMLNHLVELYGD